MEGSLCVLFSSLIVLCAGYSAGPTCNRPNEKLDCVTSCPPERTCKNRGIQFYCLQVQEKCQHKCVCKDGFIRNLNGACVAEKECDLCTGEHEYFECGPACDNVCSELHIQNKTNCPIINIVCNRMCYCVDGYARDGNNKCVPIEKCGTCHKPNEVYKDCKKTCPPELCVSLVAKYKCDSNARCQSGCGCKPGYLRKQDNSPCVPLCECSEMKNSPDCAKAQS